MPVYQLAQVRLYLGHEAGKGVPDTKLFQVHASDPNLLDYVLTVFNLRLQQDPVSLCITTRRYYCEITNSIKIEGKQVTRDAKALEGLLWELLGGICSQGWEPFSAGSSHPTLASITEDYCFRRIES